MNHDAEHLRLLSIFHYVVAGVAAFLLPFSRCFTQHWDLSSSRYLTTRRVILLRTFHQPRSGGCSLVWEFSVPTRCNVCHRSAPCRSTAFLSKTLLVRIRRRLYRMHLRPGRHHSRRVYDYCPLTRICEDVVFKCCGSAPLKIGGARPAKSAVAARRLLLFLASAQTKTRCQTGLPV